VLAEVIPRKPAVKQQKEHWWSAGNANIHGSNGWLQSSGADLQQPGRPQLEHPLEGERMCTAYGWGGCAECYAGACTISLTA
jgi:hypothetical protein